MVEPEKKPVYSFEHGRHFESAEAVIEYNKPKPTTTEKEKNPLPDVDKINEESEGV